MVDAFADPFSAFSAGLRGGFQVGSGIGQSVVQARQRQQQLNQQRKAQRLNNINALMNLLDQDPEIIDAVGPEVFSQVGLDVKDDLGKRLLKISKTRNAQIKDSLKSLFGGLAQRGIDLGGFARAYKRNPAHVLNALVRLQGQQIDQQQSALLQQALGGAEAPEAAPAVTPEAPTPPTEVPGDQVVTPETAPDVTPGAPLVQAAPVGREEEAPEPPEARIPPATGRTILEVGTPRHKVLLGRVNQIAQTTQKLSSQLRRLEPFIASAGPQTRQRAQTAANSIRNRLQALDTERRNISLQLNTDPELQKRLSEAKKTGSLAAELAAAEEVEFRKQRGKIKGEESKRVALMAGDRFVKPSFNDQGVATGIDEAVNVDPNITAGQAVDQGFVRVPVADRNIKTLEEIIQGEGVFAQLDELSNRVITEVDPIQALLAGPGKVVRGLFNQEFIKTFNAARAGFATSILAKRIGAEAGVLTNQDIERVQKMLPTLFDSKDIRDLKVGMIRDLIDFRKDFAIRLATKRGLRSDAVKAFENRFRARLDRVEQNIIQRSRPDIERAIQQADAKNIRSVRKNVIDLLIRRGVRPSVAAKALKGNGGKKTAQARKPGTQILGVERVE